MENIKEKTKQKSMDAEELVKRAKFGEKKAFDDLVKKYQGRIYAMAYRYTRNSEDALDLSQEIFLRAYETLSSFQGRSTFYTWLYQVGVNICIDFIRRNSKYQVTSFENLNPKELKDIEPNGLVIVRSQVSPLTRIEKKEMRWKIAEYIKQLPAKQRIVFVLRYQDGLLLREIADKIGRSEGTVKAHLFSASSKMKRMLEGYVKNG